MRKYLVSGLSVAIASVAFASAARADQPYGTAGCGLGSIVFGNSQGIVQIFAATTNGLFGTQTFGITSGTSNCVNTGSSSASAKAFIQANRETMVKEIARGNGETISSLSALAGCNDASAVGSVLQHNFQSIFPNERVSDIDVSNSVVSSLQAHPELACKSLS
jgi:alkylated DNA nucleotide flippase Atl1